MKTFSLSILTTILIIGLCLCPTITADQYLKTKLSDIYVDDSLYLNNNFIPILKNTLSKCNNSSIENVITSMINILEQKGEITAEDIRNILFDLQIKTIWICFLKLIAGRSSGKFFCFPGILIAYFFGFEWGIDNPPIPYIGPSIILLGTGNIEILRIGQNIKANYYVSIGFLGLVTHFSYEHYQEYLYYGISYLTFIIPDE